MPRKVMIIADPGIDTAFAVALALSDPALEVVGLLPTAGNVTAEQATANVHTLIDVLDPPKWPRLAAALPARYTTDGLALHGPGGLGGGSLPPPTPPPLPPAPQGPRPPAPPPPPPCTRPTRCSSSWPTSPRGRSRSSASARSPRWPPPSTATPGCRPCSTRPSSSAGRGGWRGTPGRSPSSTSSSTRTPASGCSRP